MQAQKVHGVYARAAERIFIWGAKAKKGTVMSKRALTVYIRIIITTALMKYHCRHKVSFYMLSVVFFSWGELNKTYLPPPKKKKKKLSNMVTDKLTKL